MALGLKRFCGSPKRSFRGNSVQFVRSSIAFLLRLVLAVLLWWPSPAIAVSLSPAMTPDAIHAIVHTAKAAWIEGDAEAFADLFTPAGQFIVPGQQYQGPDQIRVVMQNFAAAQPQVQIEIRQIVVEGDRAFVEWVWHEQTDQGWKRDEDAIAIDFQDGKITRWREYIDDQTCHQ